MVRPGRERLSGRVELDETYWGAPESGRQGRGAGKKFLIVIARDRGPEHSRAFLFDVEQWRNRAALC